MEGLFALVFGKPLTKHVGRQPLCADAREQKHGGSSLTRLASLAKLLGEITLGFAGKICDASPDAEDEDKENGYVLAHIPGGKFQALACLSEREFLLRVVSDSWAK